jgi:endonuclease YncB( thermonuclease family)
MLRPTGTIIFSLFLALLCNGAINGQRTLKGQVVDILDGKTVVMQAASGRITVELQFIEVPVSGEPMADIVKEHLRVLVQGKNIDYLIRNIRSDRTVGRLTANAVDISQQMLRDGAAWHVPENLSGQDSSEFELYASTEATAKSEKRGIWSVPELKPAWETPMRSSNAMSSQRAPTTGLMAKPPGVWGDKNPRLGNIGALVNGYNAESKAGYLSTSLMGLKELGDYHFDGELGLDVTYFYKESEGKGPRKGIYVFTLVSESRKIQFLKDNDLWVVVGDKKLNIGRPARSIKSDGEIIREVLKYRISRETLEKLVNNDEAYLKISKQAIYLVGTRYLLYNMLQLSN